MWSDREIDDFSTFGRAEKVSVFKGFRLFSKILRRAWWLSPERSALPSWATPRYLIFERPALSLLWLSFCLRCLGNLPISKSLPLLISRLLRHRRRSKTSPSRATPHFSRTRILYHAIEQMSRLFDIFIWFIVKLGVARLFYLMHNRFFRKRSIAGKRL